MQERTKRFAFAVPDLLIVPVILLFGFLMWYASVAEPVTEVATDLPAPDLIEYQVKPAPPITTAATTTTTTVAPAPVVVPVVEVTEAEPEIVVVVPNQCAEFDKYRQAYGLPAVFTDIARNKTNCEQSEWTATSTEVSWLGIPIASDLADDTLREAYNACGVYNAAYIDSNTDEEKHNTMCVASARYTLYGLDIWE